MNKYIRYKENNKNKICLHCGAENEKDAIKCKVCDYDEFGYSHGNSFKIDKETRQIICGCGCKDKLILKYREKLSGPIMDRIDIQKYFKTVDIINLSNDIK